MIDLPVLPGINYPRKSGRSCFTEQGRAVAPGGSGQLILFHTITQGIARKCQQSGSLAFVAAGLC